MLSAETFSVEARPEAVLDDAPPIELVYGEKLVSLFEDLKLVPIAQRAKIGERLFDEHRQ